MHFFTKYILRHSLLFSLLLMLVAGCKSAFNISGIDISSMYTGLKDNSLQLNQLYNINDSISTITISLPAGLILPDPTSKKYTKKGTLKYEVISEGKHTFLVDSATFLISDTSNTLGFISHTWTFKAKTGKDYYVKASYTVPEIRDDFLMLEFFSKKNHASQSWYRFQTESGEYISGNITAFPQPVRLITEDTSSHKLLVKLFSRDFPTPIPPFVEKYREPFDYKPDSTFWLYQQKGKTEYFFPKHTGFYFFQSDTNILLGPSYLRMESGFPKVSTHDLMRDALQYITSYKEFQQLNSHEIPKMAVDSFWIVNTGRPDLATELIRKYYQRVETANRLYTSFTDGWKTDRGMIFIVMGKPMKVFRSFDQEVWLYGEYDDPRSLKLYFNKVLNPFTNNDYVLARNAYLQSIWFQNVQLWRK